MRELVTVDRPTDGVAVITMRRPEKKNALSIALRDAITDALDGLAADETTRAVVLAGDGPVFSAGFDLTEFQEPDSEFRQRLWASSDRFHSTVRPSSSTSCRPTSSTASPARADPTRASGAADISDPAPDVRGGVP